MTKMMENLVCLQCFSIKGTNFGSSNRFEWIFFQFQKFLLEDYKIIITYVGYDSIVEDLRIESAKLYSKNFYMTKSAFVLGETVVSAERQEMKTQTRISMVKVSPNSNKTTSVSRWRTRYSSVFAGSAWCYFYSDQGGQLYIREAQIFKILCF